MAQLFNIEYMTAMVLGFVMLIINLYVYLKNNLSSKFSFVSSISILFIICDVFYIPYEIANFVLYEGTHRFDGLYLKDWIWCHSIAQFVTDVTFIFAHWKFAIMHYRISARLKEHTPPKEARDSGLVARSSLNSSTRLKMSLAQPDLNKEKRNDMILTVISIVLSATEATMDLVLNYDYF